MAETRWIFLARRMDLDFRVICFRSMDRVLILHWQKGLFFSGIRLNYRAAGVKYQLNSLVMAFLFFSLIIFFDSGVYR